MKRAALILLFSLSAHAVDLDKLFHGALHGGIAGGTYYLLDQANYSTPFNRFLFATAVSFGIGLGKEWIDSASRGSPIDTGDLLANGIGAVLGAGFYWTFDKPPAPVGMPQRPYECEVLCEEDAD